MSATEKWVDSHCHLDSLESPPDEAISASRKANVEEIVNVGTDLRSSAVSIELAEKYSCVSAAVGIHPHEARHADNTALAEIAALAGNRRVVAIGEIGLDFFRDHSPRDLQIEAFRSQLQIAGRLRKPVILHIRDAHPEVFKVLEQARHAEPLIFHCFSGGPREVEHALELGGYISFAGNVSYKKSELIREAARHVPFDRLLVETDAPYLAPMPYRGKPNEPALVPHVGKALAAVIGCTAAEVAEVTRRNAHRIFGLSPAL